MDLTHKNWQDGVSGFADSMNTRRGEWVVECLIFSSWQSSDMVIGHQSAAGLDKLSSEAFCDIHTFWSSLSCEHHKFPVGGRSLTWRWWQRISTCECYHFAGCTTLPKITLLSFYQDWLLWVGADSTSNINRWEMALDGDMQTKWLWTWLSLFSIYLWHFDWCSYSTQVWFRKLKWLSKYLVWGQGHFGWE